MSGVLLCIMGSATTPMTGVASNGSLPGNTTGTAYTGSCYPSVTVSGGSGGYTYSWSFTSNPDTCTLANATSQSCTVSHSIGKYGFDGTEVLQCVINDSSGHSLTMSNITAVFSST